MPPIAPRIAQMNASGSDGWELFLRAREMVAAGRPVIELTIGEHDVPTDPAILDAMDAAARGGHTGYAMVPGHDALRTAIARRLAAQSGVPTGPENVLVTPGGQSALFAAHLLACAPGDAALYLDPHYATYPGTIRAASARAVRVPTDPARGFLPDPEAVARAARDHAARSLLINTPNNPTGRVYPEAVLEGLAEVARARDLWMISDEVYDTQVWQGAHLSPRALPGMEERTLVVGSMSKSFAMTGSRIGWIAGPARAISHLIDLATVTTYGVAGFIQKAALAALEAGPAFERGIAAPFARRREIAREILEDAPGLRLLPPEGAMYLMLDVRPTGLSGEGFASALLEEEEIAVMPGESFGEAARGHIRVAMTVPDAQFRAALTRLARFAEARAAAVA
ncbi:aminotransferase class I/II-fold pyridoxal phosphate-dependent enzyme [Roseivivax sp. GX 12232]|uniref:pyridoxal phosphate-dependent aminotransferase n=1 Tax=Roseivivax sp. GX 12232 TaxID=2900547 RepID=UPI001E3E5374|nr:aminotransferase class I/II-fold pyridoxal phosphate-dependent enzyme [Roseivivax sp. GX 12232]MCE0504605.1 aminotransferase class I/II-fold pyridoxal phosphate-dependent enzyme [Roseivivax sp. GX 12232]